MSSALPKRDLRLMVTIADFGARSGQLSSLAGTASGPLAVVSSDRLNAGSAVLSPDR
jgi:hypothetical protein